MTIYAFTDANDGYYETPDLPEGVPLPAWTEGLTPTERVVPVIDPRVAIYEQIALLEASVTDRRIREAVLGIDNNWLAGVNDQIASLRAQLANL